MKVASIELQINGNAIASVKTDDLKDLVTKDLKAKGIKPSTVQDVEIYINIEDRKAVLHYVAAGVEPSAVEL